MNKILDKATINEDSKFYKRRVPEYINSNLNPSFGLRPYQQEALGRFVFYWNEYQDRPKGMPTQLLYHMATGSGKTLIMAGLILHLYEVGYRNFLFFVNSTNIIDKTRDNFLNKHSSKYLFSDAISIGSRQIRIKEVDNFQVANQDDINIVFSTIQGLHLRLNSPKENSITYDDFESGKIVLISDEAHHINVETKKGTGIGSDGNGETVNWEGTVNRIFNTNADNVLLEFTATADLILPEIGAKYINKLIFDYSLRQFRLDGYSKEINVLQTDLPAFGRALHGVLISQYRRKMFEKYGKSIKPVILFKSKTIKESQLFFIEFESRIRNLSVSDLDQIRMLKTAEIIERMFHYFEANGLSLENLIAELKEDFSEAKLISVNSKEESVQKQLAVNSLEDEGNVFRAIFAVDKLNEGWDVLNLFDIVRLYDTKDANKEKSGKTTMAEAQLIGRGARYCPFQISENQMFFSRKFDGDIENELRVCEELYYHSAYNPRYIQELNTVLEEIGIKERQTIEMPIKLKGSFKDSAFYQNAKIFLNEQQKHHSENIFGIIPEIYKIQFKEDNQKPSIVSKIALMARVEKREVSYRFGDFGENIVRKALNRLEFYQFSHLKHFLPKLNSISEFITSKEYLGRILLVIEGLPNQALDLSPSQKLDEVVDVLKDISLAFTSNIANVHGSVEFKLYLFKDKIKDRVLKLPLYETKFHLDLSKKDWYVFDDSYGTAAQNNFISYFDQIYPKLEQKYNDVYLIKNEGHFKFYNFEDERAIEPDFVLFLLDNQTGEDLHYQIFIDAKVLNLIDAEMSGEISFDSLKNDLLLTQLWQAGKYMVWGPAFYKRASQKVGFGNQSLALLD
ncbi:MAG: DEAD/DEAH box helicase family protein [Chitinophagaceae bacterium]